MSLRTRLLLLFAGLLALLLGAEAWLVRSLTSDLSREAGTMATSVGREFVRVFATVPAEAGKAGETGEAPEGAPAEDGAGAAGRVREVREIHLTTSPSGETKTETVTSAGPNSTTTTRVYRNGELQTENVAPRTTSRFLVFRGPHLSTSIPIPEGGLGKAVERFRRRLLFGSLGIFGAGLALAAVAAHRATAPLRELARAARAVGQGELGTLVVSRGSGEVSEAVEAFNRMSAQLGELEKRAKEADERRHLGELGEVGRGLAHALRNPLHAIGLSVEELAARQGDDAEASAIAEGARRQIRRVDGSLRSFLALASAGAGSEEESDGASLVREVVLAAAQDARGRVRIDVAAPGPLPLRAVPAEVQAALQALVVNAVEASPDGATVRVTAAAEGSGGMAVTVEDDGPGLPAEVRSRLFTPHVTTKPAGSGMGLFLAHRIATGRYGGSLVLEEGSPRGTRARAVFLSRRGEPDA